MQAWQSPLEEKEPASSSRVCAVPTPGTLGASQDTQQGSLLEHSEELSELSGSQTDDFLDEDEDDDLEWDDESVEMEMDPITNSVRMPDLGLQRTLQMEQPLPAGWRLSLSGDPLTPHCRLLQRLLPPQSPLEPSHQAILLCLCTRQMPDLVKLSSLGSIRPTPSILHPSQPLLLPLTFRHPSGVVSYEFQCDSLGDLLYLRRLQEFLDRQDRYQTILPTVAAATSCSRALHELDPSVFPLDSLGQVPVLGQMLKLSPISPNTPITESKTALLRSNAVPAFDLGPMPPLA